MVLFGNMHSEQKRGQHNIRTDGRHSKETQQAANQPHKQKQTAGAAVPAAETPVDRLDHPLASAPSSPRSPHHHPFSTSPKVTNPSNIPDTATNVKVEFGQFSFHFRRYYSFINFSGNRLPARMSKQEIES